MAIIRSAGTEIIRSAHFETVTDTTQDLILGVQHHIYTVLSIIIHANGLNAAGDYARVWIQGYDSKQGTTNQMITLFQEDFQLETTFVWNDKFSFNGYEPIDYTGPLSTVVEQDAIADRGSGVLQTLAMDAEHSNDDFDVHVTYIDQNNS
ncbi:uncharacterized protein METZ01_LOCUS498324 [marine metagenome]|uniref:Uncharacterized protein n=1 Tax=marine metagenome TaxID=408172 RepID=A0A383DMH8_9ZZZZ